MLGLPSAPGVLGVALLVLGLIGAASATWWVRGRLGSDPVTWVLAGAFALSIGLGPFFVWRFVEDIRYTSGLAGSDRDGAGPIQAFLQPYLLDTVPPLIPEGDTYAVVAGASVPEDSRPGFPALALNVLFPRISVAKPAEADWLVAWGVRPGRVASVSKVIVAQQRSGAYPALYVARIAR